MTDESREVWLRLSVACRYRRVHIFQNQGEVAKCQHYAGTERDRRCLAAACPLVRDLTPPVG